MFMLIQNIFKLKDSFSLQMKRLVRHFYFRIFFKQRELRYLKKRKFRRRLNLCSRQLITQKHYWAYCDTLCSGSQRIPCLIFSLWKKNTIKFLKKNGEGIAANLSRGTVSFILVSRKKNSLINYNNLDMNKFI